MKVNKKFYQDLHKELQKKFLEEGQSKSFRSDAWIEFTAIWRNAWRDVNVFCCYDNNYRYYGKDIKINHLYLPEQLDVTQFELGRNRYKWGNVIHVKEEFNADGTCIVTRKKDKGDLTDREFIKILGRKTSVDPSLIYTFVRRYRKRLIDLGIQGNRPKDLIVGWDPRKGKLCYNFWGPLDGYAPEQPHSGVLRFGQHTDAACLCFAATVFSLLKQPMKSVMKKVFYEDKLAALNL